MIPQATRAAIFGCLGLRLSAAEARFFGQVAPWGFILFARNVDSPAQLRALCQDLRDAVGWEAPIFIDQEGGRVARLGPPHWRVFGPALALSAHPEAERAMFLRARLIAEELRAVGIDGNCTPLADLARPETHAILRDRTYGETVAQVVTLARANAAGTLAGGVLPVLKHIPGHGRATADSHLELPRVSTDLATLEASDFAPFRALADLPLAMSAHVVYGALDPERAATVSPIAIEYIRQAIGFDGLLMTDDLSMQALSGDLAQRTQDSLAAGCDLILHCNGKPEEMAQIAAHLPVLEAAARAKAAACLALRAPQPIDITAAAAEFEALTGAL